MEFPFSPTTLFHKFGGTITTIHGVGHTTDKPQDGRSRDWWWFDVTVDWKDGKPPSRHEIEAWKLVAEDPPNNPEFKAVWDAMNEHLGTHGQWCRKAPHEGWYANRTPQRRAA